MNKIGESHKGTKKFKIFWYFRQFRQKLSLVTTVRKKKGNYKNEKITKKTK